jgi:Tfp pilus assembly protein PilX
MDFKTSPELNRGVTLLLVIVLLATLFLVAAGAVTAFKEEVGFSRRQSDSAIAAAAADAGIEHAEYKIMQIDLAIPTSTYECPGNCYIDKVDLDKGWYQIGVSEYHDSPTSTYSIIKSVGGYMGVRRSFEVKFYEKKTE